MSKVYSLPVYKGVAYDIDSHALREFVIVAADRLAALNLVKHWPEVFLKNEGVLWIGSPKEPEYAS